MFTFKNAGVRWGFFLKPVEEVPENWDEIIWKKQEEESNRYRLWKVVETAVQVNGYVVVVEVSSPQLLLSQRRDIEATINKWLTSD